MYERCRGRYSHTNSRSLDALELTPTFFHLRLLLSRFHPRVTDITVGGQGVSCQVTELLLHDYVVFMSSLNHSRPFPNHLRGNSGPTLELFHKLPRQRQNFLHFCAAALFSSLIPPDIHPIRGFLFPYHSRILAK
jgi:hypothetical protein